MLGVSEAGGGAAYKSTADVRGLERGRRGGGSDGRGWGGVGGHFEVRWSCGEAWWLRRLLFQDDKHFFLNTTFP